MKRIMKYEIENFLDCPFNHYDGFQGVCIKNNNTRFDIGTLEFPSFCPLPIVPEPDSRENMSERVSIETLAKLHFDIFGESEGPCFWVWLADCDVKCSDKALNDFYEEMKKIHEEDKKGKP